MQIKYRYYAFRVILFSIVLVSIEIIGYLGMWMNSSNCDFLSNKNYFQIRAMLIGDKSQEKLPRYLSLPYLGYIPYPKYSKNNIIQHNQDGYRGEKISLQRTSKYRIICIGGSTTYGFGVDSPSQSYPAQLEKLLNNYLLKDTFLNKKYSGVEVLNAGLEAGNSAEELQQYLFKYRYFNPDAVIVHSGINDAQIVCSFGLDFQFDYTHYRRINFHLEQLPPPASVLLKSYFCSFIIIKLFYSNFSNKKDEFMYQYKQTFCKWTNKNIDSIIDQQDFENYPFYRNTESLYQEIINSKSKLIVLPCLLNKQNVQVMESKKYVKIHLLNKSISKMLCSKINGYFIEFDSLADNKTWIDDCHLNEKGEADKAKSIMYYVINAIKRR